MEILLGFEVGTGEKVYMTNAHTVVTGMTQLSGKTTCLQALVERGNVTAIAFLTKRGESGFRGQREIQPYFREQKKGELIDWQYVSAILEATMGERMKFERSWIINSCKGAHSLQEVYENIKRSQKSTTRGLDESIYTNLAAYFEIILPEIAKYNFADKLTLMQGFNVLNLIGMADEMQQLVIESVLSYVLKNLRHVVVVIPEAHKFMPQGLKTPAKGTALKFIKEGAGIYNYMWLDSQETTSMDKAVLKQCSNWIMGYQQEKNEVANVRENLGRRKIKDEDIMTLKRGHFIASLQQKIRHVYIWPSRIEQKLARDVALGLVSPEVVKDLLDAMKQPETRVEAEELQHKRFPTRKEVTTLEKELKEGGKEIRVTLKGLKETIHNMEDQEKAYRKTIDELKKEIGDTKELVNSLKIKYSEDLKEEKRWEEIAREQADTLLIQQGLLSRFKKFEGAILDFLVPRIEHILSEIEITVDEEMVRKIVDEKIKALTPKQRRQVTSGDTGIPWVDLWMPKLGTAERKILRFMAKKFPLKMTKSQIALGIGLTTKGGYFSGAFNKLIKNKLIIQEGEDYILAEGPP